MDPISQQPRAASSRSFPPRPESVALARRFVRTALGDLAAEPMETAEVLVSELVTNAVLHARTEIEVSVRRLDQGVHVGVRDQRPSRLLVPQGRLPLLGPGQGLAMVERLASRYGVEAGGDHKTVWCELWRAGGLPPAPSSWQISTGAGATAGATADAGAAGPGTDAAYATDAAATVASAANAARLSGPTRDLTLVDLPGALYLASQQHRHALLRELTLAAFAGEHFGVRPEDLATAHDVNNVISACVTTELENQPPAAYIHSLRLPFPADATRAVLTLRHVLDVAEEVARDERLLTWPALPQNRVFRQWLLDQLISQLAGGSPVAWTVMPREQSASPSELVPCDASHVWASRVPTIAADDENQIIAANGPAADLLGWQAEELVGQRLTALIPEHLRERHVAAFNSLLLTGRSHILGRSVPLPALHRDGRLVPVRLLIQTQGTTDGRTVFVAQLAPRAAPPAPNAPDSLTSTGSQQIVTTGTTAEEDVPARPAEEMPHAEETPPEDTRDAEADGPALEQQLALLTDLGEALSSAANLDEGLQRVCRLLAQRLADWCVVDLLDESDRLERVCITHHNPWELPADTCAGTLPPVTEAARGPLARVLRGAGPLLLTEAPALSRSASELDTHYVELFEQMEASSALVAPLRVRGAVFGALTLARTGSSRPFTSEDLPLIDGLVRNLSLGVENARLYQVTRQIAERLQHSLLPTLPDIPHLQMAARYAPSSTTAQIGGDWYDSFSVPSGETALVIGDVTGHDLEAAIAMSQLRSMLRGIAIDRHEPPGEVLRRLDIAHHTLFREATATCIYALVSGPEGGPWNLAHSSAGHLPPLLTTQEGDTRYLEGGAGLLLGMDPDLPRPGATDPLPAHSTVLLYTDGLIERRDESLDEAMSRLRRHTAALARKPLDVFCDELLIALSADNADDIALLALRPVPCP